MKAKVLQNLILVMRTGSLLGLSLGLPGVLLMACEAAVPARPAPPQPTITLDREDAAESTTSEPAKEDDAWLAMEHMLDGAATPRPSPSPDQQVAAAPANLQPYHALVLQTFPGDSNGEAAAVWRKQLGTLVPPLDPDLGVHTDSKGSIVIYGHYEGWEDPKVSEDMASLKGLRVNGKRIFGPIIRTTVRPQRNPEQIHPHELLSLRAKHPEVRTIYTLEIEVWGDFDSGTVLDETRRAQAEARVSQLRAAGIPAFFHHDPISRLSMVTVGAFGEQALDPASGLTSAEVEQWQQKFPNRLANGEILKLPIQGRPELGAVSQRSRLVLVPEW